MATSKTADKDDAAKAQEAARTREEAEEKKQDETVPGGRYKVGDRLVNADGEPVK